MRWLEIGDGHWINLEHVVDIVDEVSTITLFLDRSWGSGTDSDLQTRTVHKPFSDRILADIKASCVDIVF